MGDNTVKNVVHINDEDINSDGSLKPYLLRGGPVMIFIYSTSCPHCTNCKPAIESLASALVNSPKNSMIYCLNVNSPDEPVREASSTLNKVYPSRGVPCFMGFNSQGKFVKPHEGQRGVEALRQFLESL